MTIAFYMDVHIPRAVTNALRLAGVDVLTAQEDQTAEWSDDQLLMRATELGRIFVSQDADLLRETARLQSGGGVFAGLLYAHQQAISIGQLVDDLRLIAAVTTREEWTNKVVFLPL